MIEFLLAAPQSGSGKTVMACALLGALRRRGFSPCAFKCGPDYIDPMFHRSVLGVACHNLDLFLTPEERLRRLYAAGTAGHDAALCEGAMGLYDGLGGTDRASAWHVARVLSLPVLLVLRPKGASLTLAAQVRGLRDFRPNSPLAGILLNDCRPALYASLASMLEKETGLPVLGYLPPMPEAVFESRHLGLYTAGEISDIKARMEALAQCALQTVDWQRLLPLCQSERKVPGTKGAAVNNAPVARIAVARDEAFCFTYAETLEALEQAGARLVPFSPLYDTGLPPEADGLYLPGGYPELYAARLSQNRAMRESMDSNIETLYHMFDHRAEAVEFRVDGDSAVIGVPLKDLPLKSDLLVSSIFRGGKVLIPNGQDMIRKGDTIMVVTTHTGFSDIQDILA